MILDSKLDSAEKKSMKVAKANDTVWSLWCFKVQFISNKTVGEPGGPPEINLNRLRATLEKGHVFGADLTAKFREKGF